MNSRQEYQLDQLLEQIANLETQVSELTKQYHYDAEEVKSLRAKKREFISALEKIRMMSINVSVESNRQIRELITVTLLDPLNNKTT